MVQLNLDTDILIELRKLDLRFLRFLNDVFNNVVMNLNITCNQYELFDFLNYAIMQHSIMINYCLYTTNKYARLIRVIVKRIERILGASRFDIHIFRVEANDNANLPY